MRTKERWEEKILPKLIETKFTPRIRDDLLSTCEWVDRAPFTGGFKVESTYIYGNVGYGKTILAATKLLIYELDCYLREDTPASKFISFVDLTTHLRSCLDNPAGGMATYHASLDYHKYIHFLVLDDVFGTTKPTDWVIQLLYELINHRYEYQYPTIYTSNHSLDEAAKIIGDDRITSRIERQCKIIKKKDWRSNG
jgi:DNA replication protein DnaC